MRELAAACALLAASAAEPAHAWGFLGHRIVVGRAVAALEPPLAAFAQADVGRMEERSLDPDIAWREECGMQEGIQHFFDLDRYGGDAALVPRDVEVLRARWGGLAVVENGLLPWRIEEFAHCLERAFRARDLVWARDLMGQLAHYTADLEQPHHLTSDHDGQSTGQRGIHQRYERDLVERNERRLRRALAARPIRPTAVADPLEAAFAAMAGAEPRVAAILAGDAQAGARHGLESRAYYREMWRTLGPDVVVQLGEAVALTAGIWTWAWEAAGRPPLAEPEASRR